MNIYNKIKQLFSSNLEISLKIDRYKKYAAKLNGVNLIKKMFLSKHFTHFEVESLIYQLEEGGNLIDLDRFRSFLQENSLKGKFSVGFLKEELQKCTHISLFIKKIFKENWGTMSMRDALVYVLIDDLRKIKLVNNGIVFIDVGVLITYVQLISILEDVFLQQGYLIRVMNNTKYDTFCEDFFTDLFDNRFDTIETACIYNKLSQMRESSRPVTMKEAVMNEMTNKAKYEIEIFDAKVHLDASCVREKAIFDSNGLLRIVDQEKSLSEILGRPVSDYPLFDIKESVLVPGSWFNITSVVKYYTDVIDFSKYTIVMKPDRYYRFLIVEDTAIRGEHRKGFKRKLGKMELFGILVLASRYMDAIYFNDVIYDDIYSGLEYYAQYMVTNIPPPVKELISDLIFFMNINYVFSRDIDIVVDEYSIYDFFLIDVPMFSSPSIEQDMVLDENQMNILDAMIDDEPQKSDVGLEVGDRFVPTETVRDVLQALKKILMRYDDYRDIADKDRLLYDYLNKYISNKDNDIIYVDMHQLFFFSKNKTWFDFCFIFRSGELYMFGPEGRKILRVSRNVTISSDIVEVIVYDDDSPTLAQISYSVDLLNRNLYWRQHILWYEWYIKVKDENICVL